MLNDLDVIKLTFPREQEKLRVYALGDLHVGSPNYNEKAVKKKIDIIKDDDDACVMLCGDLADFGLKNSKSNVYFQTMNSAEQQAYLVDLLYPIRTKIASIVPGNHEERVTKETSLCPNYDMAVLLGCQDKYRHNVAITKFSFGSVRGKKQQITFLGINLHGSSKAKHHKHILHYDCVDFAISGHTHSPSYTPEGRIAITQSGTALWKPFAEIVVDAHLEPGGYGIKHEYEIPTPPILQYLELSAEYESDRNRTLHRRMDYHSIQI